MKITVELPDYFEDEDSLGEKVVEAIAQQCRNLVEHQAKKSAESEIKAIYTESYQKELDRIMEATLLDRFQLTNEYGEAKSEPTTIRELIIKQAEKRFDMKVDAASGGSTTYRKPSCTLVEYMVNKALKDAIGEHLAEIESKIRKQASAAMLKHLETQDA